MESDEQRDGEYYTLQEVAQRLRMSKRTLHRKLDNSEISGDFFARRWHFTETHIQAYIKSSSRLRSKGIKKKRKYTKRDKGDI